MNGFPARPQMMGQGMTTHTATLESPLARQFLDAVAGTYKLAALNDLAHKLWQAFGSGLLTDDEASSISLEIEMRRRPSRVKDRVNVRAPDVPRQRNSQFPPKRRPQGPEDRSAALQRRYHLSTSFFLPTHLARLFTTAQRAVLKVVSDAVQRFGVCSHTLAEIAARAGCGITTARNTIRLAARKGLVTIEERRREGRENDSNLVRIIDAEWLNWQRHNAYWLKRERSASYRQTLKSWGSVENSSDKNEYMMVAVASRKLEAGSLRTALQRGTATFYSDKAPPRGN